MAGSHPAEEELGILGAVLEHSRDTKDTAARRNNLGSRAKDEEALHRVGVLHRAAVLRTAVALHHTMAAQCMEAEVAIARTPAAAVLEGTVAAALRVAAAVVVDPFL